jgi:hypothetical protein
MNRPKPSDLTRRRFLKGLGVAAVLPAAAGEASAQPAGDITNSPRKPPTGSHEQESEFAFVISSSQPAVLYIPETGEPLARLGAEHLANYLGRVTGVNPEIVASAPPPNPPAGRAAIVLTIDAIPYFRPDGYRLGVETGKSAVCVTATAGAGLKYGCYRLIRAMRQQGRKVCVPPLKIEVSPCIKTRELELAEIQWGPTSGEKKVIGELQNKFDYINWDNARIEQYVDLIDSFGYNSVMADSPGGLAQFAGNFVTRQEAELKMEGLFRHARHNGMGTSFFVWGQEGVKDAYQNRNCPRDAEQHADIIALYMRLIDRFGPLLDQWIMHWADPGGCQLRGCTINTPQVMTNEFAAMVRQKGQSATVSFSLWGLRWRCWEWHWEYSQGVPSWLGYENWRSVVDSGVLAPEIAINLMRHYDYDTAAAIKAQDRKVGVWGWYLNDQEINYGLHIHTQLLDSEFHRMDGTVGTLLDWYSLEDNNHILNLPMLYVGAQMLWNPKASASEALFDFCDAVWGPEAAPRIHQAMLALESVRCGPGECVVGLDLWPHDYMCNMGRGSHSPAEDLARCEEGLQALEEAKIDSGYVSKFILPVRREEWLEHLGAHLRYVRDYTRVRVAYQKAMKPAVEQGHFEETQRLMAALPEFLDVIPGSYGAWSVLAFYVYLRKFADTWKGRTFSDNLALNKKATAANWFNQDPRFAPQNAVNGILCEMREEGWAADAPGPAWLKIDLGSAQTVKSVRVYNRGYRRDYWDNNLRATPAKADVFYAVQDPDPSKGSVDAGEPGYKLMGGFANWEPTDDPAAFQEIKASEPPQARWIKVVIYSAASNQRVGCGEVEVR